MARSLNKVQLIGNLGGDPELRTTPTGARVAQFSLATSRSWTNAAGEKQERTEWHKCVAWNGPNGQGLADVVERYVKKGDKLFVEGRIEYRSYEKDGTTHYVTEISVRELLLIGGRARDASPAPSAPARSKLPRDRGEEFSDFPEALDGDDDLPF